MLCTLLSVLRLVVLLAVSITALDHPHVIYIVADDMGWNDVSFHGSDQIPTPNIDALAYQGVILNNHYVQPVCTPTRAALMTGKYPTHTGLHWPILGHETSGLPLAEKIMPEYFKEMGYATHIVGKWHLGFFKKEYTPMQRGFDSHFGYCVGTISYYDHIYQEQHDALRLAGHDLRRNYSTAWDLVGQYATDLFTQEAVRLIHAHPSDTPMFLLVTHLAVHAGNPGKLLEAPQEDINRFRHISDPNRRTYAAMVHRLDQSVGEIIEALAMKRMLANSIVVFLSDNGADNVGRFNNWGSNYPWRGQKLTLFEGGMRTPSLVWSPLIAKPARVSTGLMHVTDWLPTLLTAAGYRGSLPELDGVDQWHAISHDLTTPRATVLLENFDRQWMHGIIIGRYKYIHGAIGVRGLLEASGYLNLGSIVSTTSPNDYLSNVYSSKTWVQVEKVSRELVSHSKMIRLRKEATVTCPQSAGSGGSKSSTTIDCDDQPCMFDLAADPCEQDNILDHYPVLGYFMELVMSRYKLDAYPEEPVIVDGAADPMNFNGTWSSWMT